MLFNKVDHRRAGAGKDRRRPVNMVMFNRDQLCSYCSQPNIGEAQFLQQTRQYQGLGQREMDRERGRDAGDYPDGLICQEIPYLRKVVFNHFCLLRADYGTMSALHTDFLYDFGVGLDIVRAGVDTDCFERT